MEMQHIHTANIVAIADYDQIISRMNACSAMIGGKQKLAEDHASRASGTVVSENIPGFTMWNHANIISARMLLDLDPTQKTHLREINKVKILYRDTITPEKIDALHANKGRWARFLTFISNSDGTHTEKSVDVVFGPHERAAKYRLMGILMEQNKLDLKPAASARTDIQLMAKPPVLPSALPKVGPQTKIVARFNTPAPKAPVSVPVLPKVGSNAKIAAKMAEGRRRAATFEAPKVEAPKVEQVFVPVQTQPRRERPAKPKRERAVKPQRASLFEVSAEALKRYTAMQVGYVF